MVRTDMVGWGLSPPVLYLLSWRYLTMNVVNMNFLDIQNRLREFIYQGTPIPFDGIGSEEMRYLMDLIGVQNLTDVNMNNYINQKQKALTNLWERERIRPIDRGREWISHPYVSGNQPQSQFGALQTPNKYESQPLQDPSQFGHVFFNDIFGYPKSPESPENFTDTKSISYKMKDVLTYNEYEFLSSLKIVEITDKKDIIKTIGLLKKLIDQKVFDIPTPEDDAYIFDNIIVSDDISNEAAGYTLKVIIDGDDDSSARFAMVDSNNNEVDLPNQTLPDSSKIIVDRDLDKAFGDGMVPYDIIRKY